MMRPPLFDSTQRTSEIQQRERVVLDSIEPYQNPPQSITETYKTQYKRKCANSLNKSELQVKI